MAGDRIVGIHSWHDDVVEWSEPWEFEAWRAAVSGPMVLGDINAAQFYDAKWEPSDCKLYCLKNKLFYKKDLSRKVILNMPHIKRRLAVAVWRECNRLVVRPLTPEARQIVLAARARAAKEAGIHDDEE